MLSDALSHVSWSTLLPTLIPAYLFFSELVVHGDCQQQHGRILGSRPLLHTPGHTPDRIGRQIRILTPYVHSKSFISHLQDVS